MQLKCVKTCHPWQDVLSFCSRKAWRSISFLWNIIGTRILQSSFNLFPKSTLPNCKIYNANFYWAILPSWLVCQIQLSHYEVHIVKSMLPSPPSQVVNSTLPSPPSQVVNCTLPRQPCQIVKSTSPCGLSKWASSCPQINFFL